MQQEILDCKKNVTVPKIMSNSYPLLKQFATLMKALMNHWLVKKARNRQIF